MEFKKEQKSQAGSGALAQLCSEFIMFLGYQKTSLAPKPFADYTQIESEPKGGLDGKAVYRAAPDRVSGET